MARSHPKTLSPPESRGDPAVLFFFFLASIRPCNATDSPHLGPFVKQRICFKQPHHDDSEDEVA